MTVLLHVSDPHFGTERPWVVDALLRLATEVQPEVLILSGDITQRARRGQFARARAFVDAMAPAATVAVPGNHDIPLFNVFARVFAPYQNYSRCFGRNLEPVVDRPDVLVVAVNTTRPRRHKHGEVSARQVEQVASRLRLAAERQLRVVVVHQPVLVTRGSDQVNLLRGASEAVPAWSAAGADLILGGHIHLPYVRSLRSAYPSLRRDAIVVQAGTSVSSRVRDGIPNSVNILRAGATSKLPRSCRVERWDFNDLTARFELYEQRDVRFAEPQGGVEHTTCDRM